ncbi:PREDICTED: probable E3 ubiquitin-protein ligase RHY1A [Ipomoea nil]|uniref:probable E3 ubiquitin-protein ligase RHY1A n=1 Tax=Ipomoea nil TaxID=35883 RepID=UPI000900B0DD|nr:PREDICTED: probable E3 ubiquitin-protein ligase RHY1A [Ipomoea nil]
MATVNYRPPRIRFSFESTLRSGRDTRTMIILEIVLKHKGTIFLRDRRRGEIVDSYERNTDSSVSFPLLLDSRVGLSYFNIGAFRAQVFERMPGLAPSIASELSRQMFMYARRVSLARLALNDDNGILVVTARVEIDEEEEEGESSNPPRGLSLGEINGLKQEEFKSSGAEEESSSCSICWEEFSVGVNITPLPCSHTFHHTCIATWFEKQATCPLCRFHITQPCSS